MISELTVSARPQRVDTLTGMNARAVRLLRGVLVTATAVVISSTTHVAAGGAAPGLVGLVTAVVLGSVLGTALLSGQRLTVARTAATIAGGQVVFHTVFSWGAVATVALSPHDHGAVVTPAVDALHAHDAGGMVLAHVVAGLLALAVLLVEQRVLDRIVDVARRAVSRLREVISASPLPVTARRPRWRMRSSAPAVSAHRNPVARRGPPLALSPA